MTFSCCSQWHVTCRNNKRSRGKKLLQMPRRKLEYDHLEEIAVSKDDLPLAGVKKHTKTSLAMPFCDIVRAAGRPGLAATVLSSNFWSCCLLLLKPLIKRKQSFSALAGSTWLHGHRAIVTSEPKVVKVKCCACQRMGSTMLTCACRWA